MSYDPEKHHRRSIRLKDFDYSRSATYFVTICVENRECLFGNILQDRDCENISDQLLLNDVGKMVSTAWLNLPSRFPSLILDDFVVYHPDREKVIRAMRSSEVFNHVLAQLTEGIESLN